MLFLYLLLIARLLPAFESLCVKDDALAPTFALLYEHSNETDSMASSEPCTLICTKNKFLYAAVEAGLFCFCTDTDPATLTTSTDCTSTCMDGAECGGPDGGVLTTFELVPSGGSITMTFSQDLTIIKVAETVTAAVVVSDGDFVIDWGDGSTLIDNALTHAYSLPGKYMITAYMKLQTDAKALGFVTVHDKPIVSEFNCPNLVEVGIPTGCTVTSDRQGSDYVLTWSLTNGSDTQEYISKLPKESSIVFGSVADTTDTTIASAGLTEGTLVMVPKFSLPNGGFLTRVKIKAAAAATQLGIYTLKPNCPAGDFCGIQNKCTTAACSIRLNPETCPNSICSLTTSCNADTCSALQDPLSTYSHTLLTTIILTAADHEEDLKTPFWIPEGVMLAYGCPTAADCGSAMVDLSSRDPVSPETGDKTYNPTTFIVSDSAKIHLVELFIRGDEHVNVSIGFTCHSAAPIPNSEVTPSVHDITTYDFVNKSKLGLSYKIRSDIMAEEYLETMDIVCQIKIIDAVYIPDVWMPFGKPYSYKITFSQGSPLFSDIDIDGTSFYNYHDDAINGYDMIFDLVYADEGLYFMAGNTSNLISWITYETIVHVVPEVTDNWGLVITCPCLDMEIGFPFELTLPSAVHPPWNATFISPFELGNVFPDEFIDFVTFPAGGAATELKITKTAVVLTTGTYTVNVNLSNEVSSTIVTETFTVVEGIRDVSGSFFWNNSGTVLPGLGADKNIFLANYTVFMYPFSRTGIPDMWRFRINNTGYEMTTADASENFTMVFPQEEDELTVYFGGYNSVQGWVESPPMKIKIVFRIQGLALSDTGTITKGGETRNLMATFIVFTPMACIMVDYGNPPSPRETFGYEPRCKERYPDANYMGTSLAPIPMPHVYNQVEPKVYTVKAIAFDEHEVLTHSLSVPVGDIPCTMPTVAIVHGTKIYSSATEYWRSHQIILEGESQFECNGTYPVKKWWTISQVDPESGASIADVPIENVISSWKYSQISIVDEFLDYGSYKFTYFLKVIISDTLYLERSDFTYVSIVPSPLKAVIMLGSPSKMKQGYGQQLDFNAKGLSSDPDYPTIRNLNVTWWCRQVDPLFESLPLNGDRHSIFNEHVITGPMVAYDSGLTAGGCLGKGAGSLMADGHIIFDTSSFISSEATYEFVIEVEKGDRFSSTKLTIEVVPHPPPTMLIDCDEKVCYPTINGLVINPTVRLALPGSCVKNCATLSLLQYRWTILSESGVPVDESTLDCPSIEGGSDGAVISMVPSSCVPTFITPKNASSLAVNSIFFENNINIDKFIVRLTGITEDEAEGYTEILILRNKPPMGGSCTLTDKLGDALVSIYPSVCQNWVDPESIGVSSYTYYYYVNTAEGLQKHTIASTTKTSLNLVMPVGSYELLVDISDRFNAITTYPLGPVQADMPSKEMIDNYDPTSVIAYLDAIGDSTTLGMVLNALNSVRDSADWLALDEASIANLTKEELLQRIADVSAINLNTLKTTLNTMDFSTLNQLNVGASILQSSVSGVFDSPYGAMTVGLGTRTATMELIEKLTNQIPNIDIVSPYDLVPFLSNTMDAASAVMKSVNAVISKNSIGISPMDMESAIYLDYETYIPGIGFISTTDVNKQLEDNVRYTTKDRSEDQIKRIFEMVDQTAENVYGKLVTGEVVISTSPNGASIMIAKLNEELLEDGLTIKGDSDNPATIIFPKMFCPSFYNTPGTICREEFRLTSSVWPCITHLYPDSSDVLSEDTKIIDVYVHIRKERVKVKNETLPIILRIPRMSSTVLAPFTVKAKNVDYGHMKIIYHWFNVTNAESAYTIEFKPLGVLPSNMIIMIDHERMPTPEKHMLRFLVSSMIKDTNGVYSYFVTSQINADKTGRFFAGVGVLKSNVNISPSVTLKKDNFLNERIAIDYTFRIYLSGCYGFDDYEKSWKGRGMYVVEATPDAVTCASIHLTTFGSGFLATPNFINFDFIFANFGFVDNVSIYSVLIVVTSLFIVMMIWSYFMDKKDMIHKGVIPLPDNKTQDKYLYEVTIKTGADAEASTDSNIYFIAAGDYDETDVRRLPKANNYLYRRFTTNQFVMAVPKPLGHINYLRIFHDNSGEPPLESWQLEMAVFRDLQTNEKSIFDTNAFLAFDREKGQIDQKFLCLEGEEEKTFSQQMYIRGNKTMNQDHMWMSIFTKLAQSRYSRKERVAVSATFLYLSLVVNAIWFQNSADSPKNSYLDLGLLSFSQDILIVGAIVLLVVYPFIYLLTFIFKRARPKNLKRCLSLDAIEKQRKHQLISVGVENVDELENRSRVEIDESVPPIQKEKYPFKCIPWWTRIIAWLLIIAAVAASAFFVWSYGVMWGEIKTIKFLSSFIISFLISIVVSQWIKVVLHSLMSSICLKIDLSVEDADCDEELPALKQDEAWSDMQLMDTGIRKKVHKVEGVDVENPYVNAIRERMKKEREMTQVIKGIMVYCFFLGVIYILVNGRTDYNSFLLKDHMQKIMIKEGNYTLDFTKVIQTTSDWWMWAKRVIMQETRAQRHYNNAPPYGLVGFLNDKANRMIGYAIIRQVRSLRHNCVAPSPLNQEIKHCSGERGILTEDTKSYCAKWIYNESFTGACSWQEYKYATASELGTFLSTWKLGSYTGGGYVLRLSGPQKKIIQRMTDLQKNFWIDQNTRAVSLEFSIYNANVNLFCICTIVAEFIEGGGIIPSYRFEPIRLIKNDGISGTMSTIAEILFCIAIAFFTLQEMWEMKKLKMAYFQSYWSIAEVIILFISYSAIGLYVYREMLTKEALEIFNVTFGNGYVRMDSAAYVDQFYIYAMALIVFFSTLKLIKLLQFNKRMNVLALTISKCWDELKIFLIAFAIVFFAFACLFFFMFSSDLEDFSKISSALMTTFSMMMGKFDFEAMNRANPLSPLLFFVFSVMNSWILINIMLTIIIQAFNLVKNELEKQENRLNVIDFAWNQFRQFIRKEGLPKIHVVPVLTDKKDFLAKEDNAIDKQSNELPNKVSLLVNYINDVYFDGKLDVNDPEAKKSMMSSSRELRFSCPDDHHGRKVLQSDE